MSEKRLKLEEVATNAVQRSGLHNLSFRTLADEVGVKSSSVHYYFPEKSHLARALIEKYTVEFNDKLIAIDNKKLKPAKKLDAFIKIFEHVIKQDKFCLCGMMAAEVATLDDTNRQLLSDYFRQAENWLTTIFDETSENTTSSIKPRELARIVISGLEGAILLDRVDGERNHLRAQRKFLCNLMN